MKQHFQTIQLPLIIYTGIMILFSSVPGNAIPEIITFWQWDKVAHCIEFVIFSIFLFRYLVLAHDKTDMEALWLCLLFGLIYAALDELHQLFIPKRECSIYDFAADSLGILAGTISAWQYYRKKFLHEGKVTA